MKMIMNEILTDKMLHEIFEAISRGESYGYSDGNTSVQVTPNSISIQYNNAPKKSPKDSDIEKLEWYLKEKVFHKKRADEKDVEQSSQRRQYRRSKSIKEGNSRR